LNCPWHPNKRVVSSCKDCGTDFCIECVRETDQTTLCPDCYRRKLNEIAREFTEPSEAKEERGTTPVSALPEEKAPLPPREAPAFDDEGFQPAAAAAVKESKVRRRGRAKVGKKEKPPDMPAAVPSEDFLSRGPDDDFSQLTTETTRIGRFHRKPKAETLPIEEPKEAAPPEEPKKTAPAVGVAPAQEVAQAISPEEEAPKAKIATPSEDRLLQDVMSTLLRPETADASPDEVVAREEKPAAPKEPAPAAAAVAREDRRGKKALFAKAAAREDRKEKPAQDATGKSHGEKIAERWSFLAQPRSSEYTMIAISWWRAAIFIALMLLLGAVLWAVPNAYIIPKDQEYGIHAVLVGFILGLAFWWKAGKKHSTKLAVQAALTTFFALFIGEFLHWFLIITKYKAFRTIFFDLVSFRFLWENGADILKYTMEAMFPVAFLWLLFLPTVTAFIVGFGMPPIPEIFFQAWRALGGRASEKKEASHGLEG
jgi:hypothetical protein